ncbi:MAG TPA: GntG family PLP-dependent aldolase, partial [Gaiellales bacterium]|nr:GntG family PLP-dependent aldolase [Gaiellales bacterium]
MRVVDLRSDTVTRPTAAMRRAMAEAEVGDDVWGDDPTVIALERELAALLGKQAALFVPSGSMGNQVAVRSHTQPGDEMFVHEFAHVVDAEQGGAAVLSGVQARMLADPDGRVDPAALEARLRDPEDPHHARQRLIAIENTHGDCGGRVYPLALIDELTGFARAHGLAVHMDGARLWNAAAASGVEPARIVRDVDSVSVCFSKGLGAPVGSAVAGGAELIGRARRNRKLLGGGMRQAGIVAAGALHALRHHRDRLVEDHRNARVLAEGLARTRRLQLNPERVE